MKRTDDFVAMVAGSDVHASKKTVAMNYVDSLRPLENGSASEVSAIAAAMLANAPMNLEMYLREPPSKAHVKEIVKESIQKHAGDCMGGSITQAAIGPKTALAGAILKHGGYPAVVALAIIKFAPEIKLALTTLLN